MRNKQIDVLRGLLILIIVFFHYTYRFSVLYNIKTLDFYTLTDWGAVGVAGFFIISGFFLRPKDMKANSPWRYFCRRVLRLYPLYLLAIVVIFVVISVFGLDGRQISFADFLLNVPLLNGFIGTPYVDGAHWYITYLLIFTVISAMALRIKVPVKYWLFSWLIIKIVFLALIPSFGFLAAPYKMIGGDYVEYVIIGIALSEILRFHIAKSDKRLFLLIIVWAMIQRGIVTGPVTVAMVAAFIALFVLAINGKLKVLEKIQALILIGDSSYALYLFHQNIGFVILLYACNIWGDSFIMVYVFMTMIFMVLGSFAIHKFYEVPLQKLLMNKRRKK